MSRKRIPDVPWIRVSGEPNLAECQRCGALLPMPPLPLKIERFVGYLAGFLGAHAECEEVA